MNVRLRIAAVAIALSIPGVVLGQWAIATAAAGGPVSPAPLPRRVGAWLATADEQLDADELALIDPDAYVLRRYEAPGRTPIWVYVGSYAGRAGYGKGAHDPEVCYPAQGWEIVGSRALEVRLRGSEMLWARQLQVHFGIARQAVLYWFQPSKRWPARAAVEQVRRLLDAVAGRPQYAFVRLSGPSDGRPAAAEDLAEFAAEIAPAIRTAVEEIDPGNTRERTPRESARAWN